MIDSPVMEYVKDNANYTMLPELLPVMHSCEGFDFERILEDYLLKPTMCPVFNEELLYFFYGKPSYPVGEKEKYNRTDVLCCPVCFIVDIDKINIYRIFPFDSGAYSNGLYEQFIHRHMQITKFEIENNSQSIQAYVSVVFGDNKNYIHGTTQSQDHEDTCVSSLLRMLSADGAFKIDERSNTVEVICKHSIDVRKEIRGVIFPEVLLRKKVVSDFIKNNNIEYKTYEVRNKTSPVRYNEIVFQLSKQFM